MRTTTTTPTTTPTTIVATPRPVAALTPGRVEVHQYAGTATILDVRERDELLEHGWIGGSVHVPLGSLDQLADPTSRHHTQALDPDVPVVVHCSDGRRSTVAAQRLLALGFLEVHTLAGGLAAWVDAGRAVARLRPWHATPISPASAGVDPARPTTPGAHA